MRDAQSHFYHEFETNKQNWSIDFWLREHGVKSRDLESHPRIDDMIVLLQLRNELWDRMTQPERNTWGAYWGLVFQKQYPLNQKFWKKFTGITRSIDHRQQRQQQARQRIRTLKDMDHNSEAKGSCPPESNLHENGNNGSARENQSVPW